MVELYGISDNQPKPVVSPRYSNIGWEIRKSPPESERRQKNQNGKRNIFENRDLIELESFQPLCLDFLASYELWV